MKLLWIAHHVRNLDQALQFYHSITDLKVLRRFTAGPTTEIAFLGNGDAGETTLELLADSSQGALPPPGTVSVGWQVPSVSEQRNRCLNLGIPLFSEVRETPSSQYFAVRDPDGLVVQFFEMKPQSR